MPPWFLAVLYGHTLTSTGVPNAAVPPVAEFRTACAQIFPDAMFHVEFGPMQKEFEFGREMMTDPRTRPAARSEVLASEVVLPIKSGTVTRATVVGGGGGEVCESGDDASDPERLGIAGSDDGTGGVNAPAVSGRKMVVVTLAAWRCGNDS